MRMAKVNRKKLLKEPDEFLTFSDKAIAWSKENAKLLMGAAAVLVGVVAAWVIIGTYLQHRQDEAADALAGSFESYAKAVEGKADPSQEKAARQSLAKVVEKYGATPAGIQARLALGDLLVEKGKYPEAEKVLNELCEEADLPPAMRPLAWHGLGLSLEGQKKYAEAAKAYESAMREAGPTLRNSYRLDLARVQEAAGEKEAAIKSYSDAVAQPPDPTSLDMVRSRLVALGVDPATLSGAK
jgi:predicted negative regulator of RcsB-dependent stress response